AQSPILAPAAAPIHRAEAQDGYHDRELSELRGWKQHPAEHETAEMPEVRQAFGEFARNIPGEFSGKFPRNFEYFRKLSENSRKTLGENSESSESETQLSSGKSRSFSGTSGGARL